MATVEVKNISGKKVGDLELDDAVFAEPVHEHLFWEVVKWQRAKARSGTHSTKSRGEVRATRQKMYRQKGTGRARHGNQSAPIFVGGGRAFGPRPRSYAYKMPKKARKKALRSALSLRLAEQNLIVLDEFTVEGGKTKAVAKALENVGASDKVLIVDGRDNEMLIRGARNLPSSKWIAPEGVNVYDVLDHGTLIMTKSSAEALQEALRP